MRFTACTDTTCTTLEAQKQRSGNQKNRRIRPKPSMILCRGQTTCKLFKYGVINWLLMLITLRVLVMHNMEREYLYKAFRKDRNSTSDKKGGRRLIVLVNLHVIVRSIKT